MRLDVTDARGGRGRRSPRSQQRFGDVAILVNNAGITRDNLLLRMKDDEWDAIMDTNLKSVYRLSKAVLRGMMKARHGRIIKIGSVVGVERQCRARPTTRRPRPALIGFTKSLAQEVGSRNITVNCVAPGFIDTDMTRALADGAARGAARRGFRWAGSARPRTSRRRSRFWPRPARATSPAPRCTSTAACTWNSVAATRRLSGLGNGRRYLVKSAGLRSSDPRRGGDAWKT